MSAELQTQEARGVLAGVVEPVSGLNIMTLAEVMLKSGFFPDLKGASQAVVKILAGRELGFGPVASIRHIYVHRGHIGLMSTLLASRLKSSPLFDYKLLRCDESECAIEFFRREGDGWVPQGVSTFTIAEAKRAGLIKGDSAWESYPSDLLFARAIARGQRRFAPDLFAQTIYAAEELQDMIATGDAPKALIQEAPTEEDLMPRQKDETHGVIAEADAPLPAEEPMSVPVPAEVPQEPGPQRTLSFSIGKSNYTTQGITKEQLTEVFSLCGQLEKIQKGLAKTMLVKEFGVESRISLTQETADRYLIRLKECLEG